MSSLRTDAPEDNAALREALYAGDIFLLPATDASRELARACWARVESELGPEPNSAQFRLAPEEFFSRAGRARKAIFESAAVREAARRLVARWGFDPRFAAFDPPRLRIAAHRGHENPRAAAVYAPHRDTWYGHPQCALVGWVALHELPEEEAFDFYPEFFRRPVANDSASFDYGRWTERGAGLRIGWQDPEAGLRERYPAAEPGGFGRTLGFSRRAGEAVLFAAAQLHRTRRHASGRTRFSVDFRLVDLRDAERGRGAPNADNRSRGSAVRDYVLPGTDP